MVFMVHLSAFGYLRARMKDCFGEGVAFLLSIEEAKTLKASEPGVPPPENLFCGRTACFEL